MSTIIDAVYRETLDIVAKLEESHEVSLAIDAKRQFTKTFILSAASYFEDQIQKLLIEYIRRTTNDNNNVVNFVQNKAISFQYHTYFDWGKKGNPNEPGKNANTFFSLFGNDFKTQINEEIEKNENIKTSMKCFIEIGHLRNILVHSNFAAYNNIPKTIEELNDIFLKANEFVLFLAEYLLKI
jgi:hypothetical protein